MGDEQSTESTAGRGIEGGAAPPSDDSSTRSLGPDRTGPIRVASAPPPTRVGDIDLSHELGRGGMGSVWLGHDAMLGRDVAVKFLLHAGSSPDDPSFAAFIRSTRVAAQIRSTRLTQVLSAGVQDGVPYIVMEYSPGVSLGKLLRDRAKLTLPLALAIMETVSEGVAELHEAGVVHGDLKPANVLVEPGGRVVLTDFGLAVSRPREQIAGAARGYGGTPAYMSPELFDGHATYQSDVYALGVMLFELLAGELPFTGSYAEMASAHRDSAMPLERLPDDTPEPVRDLIARATKKSMRWRPKSGRHFLDALRRAAPDQAQWVRGRAELGSLVGRDVALAPEPPRPPSSSTYDALHAMSSARALARAENERAEPSNTAPVPGVGERSPRIPARLGCVGCGHDLRGLESSGECPECATPIDDSTNPDRLLFADRAWLRLVNQGVLVSTFLFWQVGALLAARREPGCVAPPATAGSRQWVSAARTTLLWCGVCGLLVLPLMVFSQILPERFAGVPSHVNAAILIVYSAAWAVWTGDLARRGSRVPRRSAGKSAAIQAMRRRMQRPALAPLRGHAVAVTLLSGAIIALDVSVSVSVVVPVWRFPNSGVELASKLLTIVGLASLAVAWGRSVHVHRLLSEARGGLLDPAVSCIGCAYDLTGLEPGGACPECAMPIHETTDPERLIYADDAWLRSVMRGLRLMYSAPAMLFVGPFVFYVVAELTLKLGERSTTTVSPEGMVTSAFACMALSGYVGAWLATGREPRPADSPPTLRSPWIERSRRIVRWSVVISSGLSAVFVWQAWFGEADGVLALGVAVAMVLVPAQFAWAVWAHDVMRRSVCIAKRRAGDMDAARAVLKRRRRGPARTLIFLAVANVAVMALIAAVYWSPELLKLTVVDSRAMVIFYPVLAAGILAPLVIWGLADRLYLRLRKILKHSID